MQIDFSKPYDKYVDVLPFLTDESRQKLLAKAEERKPMYEMTLAEFFACCAGDFSCVIADEKHPTTGELLWIERFKVFLEEIAKVLNALVMPLTPEQKKAAEACLPVEWQEGMLVFVRKYFGLRSFAEAERVTIADYLLAKKDEYNTAIFERTYREIEKQKMRRK